MRTQTMRTLSSLHPPTRRVASLLVAGLLLALTGSALAGSYTEDFTTTTYKDPATTADWDTTAGTLGLPAFSLESVGTASASGSVRSVGLHGNVLIVGSVAAGNGLTVFDVTYPEFPLAIGFLGGTIGRNLVVSGDLVYAASVFGLSIVDITDVTTPTLIGSIGFPQQAYGVAVGGRTAYVAARTAGLQVVDVSDPTTPAILGSLLTPHANQVDVAADIACIADVSGLIVADVSDATNPDSVGAYALPSAAEDVLIDGSIVYVATGLNGVYSIDISNPAFPALLDNFPMSAGGLRRDGNRLYVSAYTSGFSILDITDPANLSLIDSYDTPGNTYNIEVAGSYVFAGTYAEGIEVVRRNHVIPDLVGSPATVSTGNAVNDLDAAGGLALVSSDAGLEIHDIWASGTLDPAVVGTFPQPARGTDVEGTLAYVASLGFGLRAVDVSDPTTPTQVGIVPTGSFALDVDVVGNLAFVADFDSGLVVVDVSDPTSPAVVGSLGLSDYPTQVVVDGTVAWVAVGSSVEVVDVSDPTTPSSLASIPGAASCLAVAGDRLYVGTSGGTVLRVYNVFNPATPASMGSVPGAGSASRLAIAGDYLFLANSDPSVGLQLIDISIGSTPNAIGSRTFGGNATGVLLHGQWAHVGHTSGDVVSLRVFQDDWDPAALGLSTEVDAYDNEVFASVRLETAPFNQVSFEVSANGGVDWQPITSGSGWNDILIFGDDLRWRSTHTYDGTSVSVSEITLDWLYPFGDISRIVDVPNDQGGRVYVEFQRSSLDNSSAGVSAITQYSVYREVTDPLPVTSGPVLASAAAVPEGVIVPEGIESRWIDGDLYVEGPEVTPLGTGFPAGTWVLVASVPSLQIEKYLVEVTTDADSSDTGTNDDTFFVIAHTTNPSSYFRSPPVTGHSVDNIAPGVPQNLAATYDQGDILLSWDAAPEEDFQYHRIYRSTDPGFVPGPGNLVHETATTSWADTPADPNAAYYKVTTLDHAGNESEPASLGTVTAVGGGNGAPVFALRGAMPNPLRAGTSIAFELPADSPVSLEVFDVTGRRIRTLAAESMTSGNHEITWDGTDESGSRVAAGVYLYRLRAGELTATRRMVVIR